MLLKIMNLQAPSGMPSSRRKRLLDGAELLQSIPSERKYLLYVTAHYAMPIEPDIRETLTSLSKNISREHQHQLFWINWQSAVATLEALLRDPASTLSDSQLELVRDTLSLLVRKTLTPYMGWRLLNLADIPQSTGPFFWRPRKLFFSGIECLALRLKEPIYFFKRDIMQKELN